MEAAASTTMQHSYGLGPRGPNPPHGAPQTQGPHQAAAGPPGAPRPEEQHHHKPFFYIQPSQPYLPVQSLQWPVPVPVPYNPYYGYLLGQNGYGMPVMPSYQPNMYMEPPGFVVPHTSLHLMDYRRMLNPQYYQTMAYHSRRFRYQHSSQAREMTTSEVQTEPLSAIQRTSAPSSGDVEASRDLPLSGSSRSLAVPNGQPPDDRSLAPKDAAPPSVARTPPNGSFTIQTEEVRIECRTTPVGLQLVHSHETAEVSHSFSSILQGRVLPDEGAQAPQACPDILLVGTPGGGEKVPALEDESTVSLGSEKEPSVTSKNSYSRAYQLPFDPKYLDELRKMESAVWSVEESLIPTTESLLRNDHAAADDKEMALAGEVPTADALMTEEMPPLSAAPKDMISAADGPRDETMSEADTPPMADVTVVDETVTEQTADMADAPYVLLLDNSSLKEDGDQHRRETTVQHHQDTSFESLPAYLPSASWLADFENIHCCGKLPPTPRKQSRPLSSHGLDLPSRRRKLEYKEQPAVRKPKERYKPKGKVDRRSLSDHECCLSSNFNENSFTPYIAKRDRLCGRCLAKRRIRASASPGVDSRTLTRKALPFRQRNDPPLPTCDACQCHSAKEPTRLGCVADARGRHRGHDTEGESSENGSCRAGPKWRPADEPGKPAAGDFKRPLASKQNMAAHPAGPYPKLREKNCACREPRRPSVAWERPRHCPHGNAIREMDENCTVPPFLQDQQRSADQINLTHRCQTEKPWKAVMPKPEVDVSQHLNKHKKSQPQVPGSTEHVQ